MTIYLYIKLLLRMKLLWALIALYAIKSVYVRLATWSKATKGGRKLEKRKDFILQKIVICLTRVYLDESYRGDENLKSVILRDNSTIS
jgi:hypothetical protein